MSAFKALRDVSNSFAEDLNRASSELFTAKIGEDFEDAIAKKLRDLTLLSSKLRLLQAKPIAASPQIKNQQLDENALISSYEDTVKDKLAERQIVKVITQLHAVKSLITASDSSLDPEMVGRKENIIIQLNKYKDKERQLLQLDTILSERHHQLHQVRQEWDKLLGHMRQLRSDDDNTVGEHNDRLASKLHGLEDKIRLVRALLARLAVARGAGYDWLADPKGRLRALQLARR